MTGELSFPCPVLYLSLPPPVSAYMWLSCSLRRSSLLFALSPAVRLCVLWSRSLLLIQLMSRFALQGSRS